MQAEDLTGAQAEYFDMLEQAGVKASARWADVAAHFANDPRFTAVAADERLMLFRSYIRMLHEMKDLRLSEAEQEFVVRRRRPCAVCMLRRRGAEAPRPSAHGRRLLPTACISNTWHSGAGCARSSRAELQPGECSRAAVPGLTGRAAVRQRCVPVAGGVRQRPGVVQRRMAERVTTSNVRWETVSKVWAGQPFFRRVSPGAAETLFVRHIARLQQAEAQYNRLCAAEVRTLLPCHLPASPLSRTRHPVRAVGATWLAPRWLAGS